MSMADFNEVPASSRKVSARVGELVEFFRRHPDEAGREQLIFGEQVRHHHVVAHDAVGGAHPTHEPVSSWSLTVHQGLRRSTEAGGAATARMAPPAMLSRKVQSLSVPREGTRLQITPRHVDRRRSSRRLSLAGLTFFAMRSLHGRAGGCGLLHQRQTVLQRTGKTARSSETCAGDRAGPAAVAIERAYARARKDIEQRAEAEKLESPPVARRVARPPRDHRAHRRCRRRALMSAAWLGSNVRLCVDARRACCVPHPAFMIPDAACDPSVTGDEPFRAP